VERKVREVGQVSERCSAGSGKHRRVSAWHRGAGCAAVAPRYGAQPRAAFAPVRTSQRRTSRRCSVIAVLPRWRYHECRW
jgi:hypothetical protein